MIHVRSVETAERWETSGAFSHLDVRTLVDGSTGGAERIMFGHTTYAPHATHERHRHPDAEEVVIVLAGHGTQEVDGETVQLGPGDVCLIPRGAPHRIAAGPDEPFAIYWILGGAASMEEAGYESVAELE